MHTQFYWSKTNAKLIKTAKHWRKRFGTDVRIVSFNIPQLKSETGKTTCPYAGVCAEVCYAAQGHMGMPAATAAYERNLAKVMKFNRSQKKLSELICEDVGNMRRVTHIRLHDSGDFFSRWYYETWVGVAEHNPDITFYAYTKSLPFLDWDSHPSNLRVVPTRASAISPATVTAIRATSRLSWVARRLASSITVSGSSQSGTKDTSPFSSELLISSVLAHR
jgi:hypothetical protein